MKKTIIVVGASSFIGTYLVDKLMQDGYNVIGTGRYKKAKDYYESINIPFIDLDISDKESFERLPNENIEAVVLLAALLPANSKTNDPYDYVRINIEGTLNCLEFCRKYGIKKFISTTSYSDVRNFWNKENPVSSDSLRSYRLNDDHAAYVISKNAASDFILMYNELYGMNGAIFRLPMVYGYGPHSFLLVDGKPYKSGFQIFIDKAVAGEDIEIYGDETIERDVVYVKDVAEAFSLAIKSDRTKGYYNISSGVGLTLKEQAKATIEVYSKDKISNVVSMPKVKANSVSFVFDISKAMDDFGYQPKYIPFKVLLEDYKKECEVKRFSHLENHCM